MRLGDERKAELCRFTVIPLQVFEAGGYSCGEYRNDFCSPGTWPLAGRHHRLVPARRGKANPSPTKTRSHAGRDEARRHEFFNWPLLKPRRMAYHCSRWRCSRWPGAVIDGGVVATIQLASGHVLQGIDGHNEIFSTGFSALRRLPGQPAACALDHAKAPP